MREVVAADRIGATVGKAEDSQAIVACHVLATPAPVIDEKITIAGRVPTTAKVRRLLNA